MAKPVHTSSEAAVSVTLPGSQVPNAAIIRWDGDEYVLHVPGGSFDPPAGLTATKDRNFYFDRGARTNVENYQPKVLWCQGDTGPFTLLDAHMKTDGIKKNYEGNRSVHGAHIPTKDAPCTGVRFDPGLGNRAYWSSSDPVELEAGTLGPWVGDDRYFDDRYFSALSVTTKSPEPLGTLLSTYVDPIVALVRLWTGKAQATPLHIEIEIPDVGWCRYGQPKTVRRQTSNLLDLYDLTLERVADWVGRAPKLGPIPDLALHQTGIFQLDALVVAVGLEGLHQRLDLNPPRTFTLDRSELKKARHAAVDAAIKTLPTTHQDRDEVGRTFSNALGYVDRPSYRQRVMQLAASVQDVAPGLTGPDPKDWVSAMTKARNDESHQRSNEFTEETAGCYFMLSTSGRWVLKICLLQQIIDDPSILTKALSRSSEFLHALENIDSENYWPGFSSADRFWEATRP